MKLLIVLTLVMLARSAWAQGGDEKRIDSLRKVIATHPQDTTRSLACAHLAKALADANRLDEAHAAVKKGIRIAKQADFRNGVAWNAYREANLYSDRGKLKEGLTAYRQALQSFQSLKNQRLTAACHSEMGLVHAGMGEYDSAVHHYQTAYRLDSMRGDDYKASIPMANLAFVYLQRGQLPEALAKYQTALRLLRNSDDQGLKATALSSIGSIYGQMGEPEVALSYELRAASLFDSCACDHANLATLLFNMSDHAQNEAQADRYLRRAYRLADSLGDMRILANAGVSMANRLIERQQLDSAWVYLSRSEQAAALSQEIDAKAFVALTSGLYYQKRGQHVLARERLNQALNVFGEMNSVEGMMRSCQSLYSADSAVGDFRAALAHYRLYRQYEDSLRSENSAREIGRLEAQFEADKKMEAERQQRASERSRNQWMLGSAAGGLLFALLLAFTLYRGRQKEKRANAEITAQRDRLDEANQKLHELDRMKEQLTGMIVHDLKNPLNVVMGLSALAPDEGRLQVIRRAGQQMSQLVSNLLDVQKYESAAVVLDKRDCRALDLLREAADQTSFLAESKRISFQIDSDPWLSVEADGAMIVRVLVNLLTNAIKYGPNEDRLLLEALRDGAGGAVFRVTDHGPGIPAAKIERVFERYAQVDGGRPSGQLNSTGLGLAFCRLTVESHGGAIRALSEPGRFTTFEFTLPKAGMAVAASSETKLTQEAEPELTARQKEALAPVLERLRDLPAYELTGILDLLDLIDDPAAKAWKNAVETAALTGHTDRLRQLLA